MKRTLLLPLSLSLFTASCIGVSVGTDDDEFFRMRGLGTAYAAVPGIDDYDGKIIRLGLLSRSPPGAQLAGIDIWPLLSVGIGFVGARVRVLPFEIGAGVLFYEPKAVRRDLSKKERVKKAAPVQNTVHDAGDVPIRPIDANEVIGPNSGEEGSSQGASAAGTPPEREKR
jgi:hypothetical protein